MRLAILALLCVCAHAQTFRVTFSHQPLEVFKAAFVAKLPSVAMYEAVVCNTGPTAGAISGGVVLQAANSKISTVNHRMVELTAARAKHRSKKYIAAQMAKWAALVGATLISGGTIAASEGIAVIFPIVAVVGDRMEKQFQDENVPVANIGPWLAPEESVSLPPASCAARLFLGRYDPKFQSFAMEALR